MAFHFPTAFAEAAKLKMNLPPGLVLDYGDPRTDRPAIPVMRMWFCWNGRRFEKVGGTDA